MSSKLSGFIFPILSSCLRKWRDWFFLIFSGAPLTLLLVQRPPPPPSPGLLLEERSEFSRFPLKRSVFRFLFYWVRACRSLCQDCTERNVGPRPLRTGHRPVQPDLTAVQQIPQTGGRLASLSLSPPLGGSVHWDNTAVLP